MKGWITDEWFLWGTRDPVGEEPTRGEISWRGFSFEAVSNPDVWEQDIETGLALSEVSETWLLFGYGEGSRLPW